MGICCGCLGWRNARSLIYSWRGIDGCMKGGKLVCPRVPSGRLRIDLTFCSSLCSLSTTNRACFRVFTVWQCRVSTSRIIFSFGFAVCFFGWLPFRLRCLLWTFRAFLTFLSAFYWSTDHFSWHSPRFYVITSTSYIQSAFYWILLTWLRTFLQSISCKKQF